MERTNWLFYYLEVQLLTTYSPSLEATGNTSDKTHSRNTIRETVFNT